MMSKSKRILICVLACAGAGLWGGFYPFTIALWGGIFSALLVVLYRQKRALYFPKNLSGCVMLILIACSILSLCTAVDCGMALIGVLRMLVIGEFWLLWNNLDKEEREATFHAIPIAGIVWIAVSFVAYFFPACKDFFYRAERLGGPFQYSNTYALFLLVGIVILLASSEWNWKRMAETALLFAGTLMTGSRSVVVLAVVTLVYFLLTGKIGWKKKIGLIVGAAVLTVGLQILLQLDLGRLLQLTLESSTLNGRFLYWLDALPVIFRYPLGLGYMGYFYVQPQIQTGNYVTRFVHNELLQSALDYGWIAAAALIFLLVYSLFQNSHRNRMILLILVFHSLFDFDLQFFVMACIGVMCVRQDDSAGFLARNNVIQAVAGLLGCIFLYFTVAFFMEYVGAYALSLRLYPGNTTARENLMYQDENATDQAKILIDSNGMLASAYEIMLQDAAMQGKYEDALKYEKQMLQCAGFDSYYYNQAVYYLSYVLVAAIQSGSEEESQEVVQEIWNVPERIQTEEEKASFFAYRINDQPEIVLEPEIEQFIRELKAD